ncbi:MAG: hypothetical protein B7Y80_20075 [Hyphomicrobium sp. 32-62-53]|nr:MAG: hypothetical protein B7Z29_19905 [Hyphomicrobium sp. 12-62-95]OYX97331.1 MAG: hypothetical protein B7Y80_20075 [Hyphomicrobium sp. 32-62-53]
MARDGNTAIAVLVSQDCHAVPCLRRAGGAHDRQQQVSKVRTIKWDGNLLDPVAMPSKITVARSCSGGDVGNYEGGLILSAAAGGPSCLGTAHNDRQRAIRMAATFFPTRTRFRPRSARVGVRGVNTHGPVNLGAMIQRMKPGLDHRSPLRMRRTSAAASALVGSRPSRFASWFQIVAGLSLVNVTVTFTA